MGHGDEHEPGGMPAGYDEWKTRSPDDELPWGPSEIDCRACGASPFEDHDDRCPIGRAEQIDQGDDEYHYRKENPVDFDFEAERGHNRFRQARPEEGTEDGEAEKPASESS